MTEGKYLVMWQVHKRVPKRGWFNTLFGKKRTKKEQVVHSFDSEEIAEYGYQNLKTNGCMKPVLLKVLRE